MNDLQAKMEAELNEIAAKKTAILSDVTLTNQKKYAKISELELKHTALRQLLQGYITLQNKFKELMGEFVVNY